MSSDFTPDGYQLENTYEFPSNSNNTLGVYVLRVDDDDNTTSECGRLEGGETFNGAGSYTATVDPATAPSGYHYVYKFMESAAGELCADGYHYDFETGECVIDGSGSGEDSGSGTRRGSGGGFWLMLGR